MRFHGHGLRHLILLLCQHAVLGIGTSAIQWGVLPIEIHLDVQSLASHEHANHAPSTDVQFDAQMCDGVQFRSVASALISSCWDPD